MSTGEKIRIKRKEKNFTQKLLGDLCGINEANIRKYELGKANPKLETIRKIAAALDVSLSYFLEDTTSNETSSTQEKEQTSQKNKEDILESKLLNHFHVLNEKGKTESVKRIVELTKLKEYTE